MSSVFGKQLSRFIVADFSLAMVERPQCEGERSPKLCAHNDRSGRVPDVGAPTL